MLAFARERDTCGDGLCRGEADLFLGAGGGADPWQGAVGVVGQSRLDISHSWEQALQEVIHPAAACAGGHLSASVTASLRAVLSSPQQPGDGGHPFLSSPAGPFPWPAQTSVCSDPAVLPCARAVPAVPGGVPHPW